MTLQDYLQKFGDLRVMVIGDILLDEYIVGDYRKLSPEHPGPIFQECSREYKLGGAANVANNTRQLGAYTIPIGIYGSDGYFETVTGLIKKEIQLNPLLLKDFIIKDGRKTNIKTRYISTEYGQELFRSDNENEEMTAPISGDIRYNALNLINDMNVNCFILSDYNKGMLRSGLSLDIIRRAKEKNIHVVSAPKPENIKYFANSTAICLNHKEAGEFTGVKYSDDIHSLETMSKIIKSQLNPDEVVITCGKRGTYVYDEGNHILVPPKVIKPVFVVIGAGDTALAALSLSISAGAGIKDAARIANYAAGIKVEKPGTATVSLEELLERINNHHD